MIIKNKQDLKKYILYLLSRREYSKFELEQKLKKIPVANNIIQEILDEFSSKNLQSDVRLCENFINSKKDKYGNLKLIYELNNKGINKNIYNNLLPSTEDEITIAKKILHHKHKNFTDSFKQKQKYINFLIARGFHYEIAISAVQNYEKND